MEDKKLVYFPRNNRRKSANNRLKKFRATNGNNQVYLTKDVASKLRDLRTKALFPSKTPSEAIEYLIDYYYNAQQQKADDLEEVNANLAASVSDLLPPTVEEQDHLTVPSTEELRSRFKYSFVLVQQAQVERLINNSYCRCGGARIVQSTVARKGTITYTIQCSMCLQRLEWATIANTPIDLGAKAVVLAATMSGISHERWTHLSHILGLPIVHNDTWYGVLSKQVQPLIFHFYIHESNNLISALGQKVNNILIADMTWDSSRDGCYGVEAFMEYNSKKVVHFELVPRKEAGTSVQAEPIGFNIGLSFLRAFMSVSEIVYDAHGSIPKLLRENHPDVLLSNDCWHWAEKAEKKAKKAFESHKNTEAALFLGDKPALIKKHVWYCLHHCNADRQQFIKMLSNFVNHVQNEHSQCYDFNPNAQCCIYNWESWPDRVPFTIVTNHSAATTLQQFMTKQIFGKKGSKEEIAGRLNRARHSSEIEAYFHACLTFTPKYTHFKSIDQYTALRCLGTLRWNAAKDGQSESHLFPYERLLVQGLMLDIFKEPENVNIWKNFTMANLHKQDWIQSEVASREKKKVDNEALKKQKVVDKLVKQISTPAAATKKRKQPEKNLDSDLELLEPPKKRQRVTKVEQQKLREYYKKSSNPKAKFLEEIQKALGSGWDEKRIIGWFSRERGKNKNKRE